MFITVLKSETGRLTSYKNVELYCLGVNAPTSELIETERAPVCVRFRSRSADYTYFRAD
jgi:hypothetical protein